WLALRALQPRLPIAALGGAVIALYAVIALQPPPEPAPREPFTRWRRLLASAGDRMPRPSPPPADAKAEAVGAGRDLGGEPGDPHLALRDRRAEVEAFHEHRARGERLGRDSGAQHVGELGDGVLEVRQVGVGVVLGPEHVEAGAAAAVE